MKLKQLVALMSVLITYLCIANFAVAMDEGMAQTQQQVKKQMREHMPQASNPVAHESDNLIGHSVVNKNGDKLGKINNLAINEQGQITYVVVGVGGLAGMGEKEIAVPFSQLDISQQQDSITLDVSKDQLTSEFAAFEDLREGKGKSQEK